MEHANYKKTVEKKAKNIIIFSSFFAILFLITSYSAFALSCSSASFTAPDYVAFGEKFNATLRVFSSSYKNASINYSQGIAPNTTFYNNLALVQPYLFEFNTSTPGIKTINLSINLTNGSICTKQIQVNVKTNSSANISLSLVNLSSRFGMTFNKNFTLIINNSGNGSAEEVSYVVYTLYHEEVKINDSESFSGTIGDLAPNSSVSIPLVIHSSTDLNDTLIVKVNYKEYGLIQQPKKANQSFVVDPVPIMTSSNSVSGTAGATINYHATYDYNGTDNVTITRTPNYGSINSTTGLFTWTPSSAGLYHITFYFNTSNYSKSFVVSFSISSASSSSPSSSSSSSTIYVPVEEKETDEFEEEKSNLSFDVDKILNLNWELKENELNLNNKELLERLKIIKEKIMEANDSIELSYLTSELNDIKRKLVRDVFVKKVKAITQKSTSDYNYKNLRNVKIESNLIVKKIWVYYYDANPKLYTVFERELGANSNSNLIFLEEIPKRIAENAELIKVNKGNYEVLEKDPLLKFSGGSYSYAVLGDMTDSAKDIKYYAFISEKLSGNQSIININQTVQQKTNQTFMSAITGKLISLIKKSGELTSTGRSYTLFLGAIVLALFFVVLFLSKTESKLEKELFVKVYNQPKKKSTMLKEVEKLKKKYFKK